MSLCFTSFRSTIMKSVPSISRTVPCLLRTAPSATLRCYHSQAANLFPERLLDIGGSPLQKTIDVLRRAGWSLADLPAEEPRLSATKRFNVPNDFRYDDHARRRKLLDVFVDKSEEVIVESIRTNQHAVRVDLSLSFAALQKLASMDKLSSVIETSFFQEVSEVDTDGAVLNGFPA